MAPRLARQDRRRIDRDRRRISVRYGENAHHMIEALFKAFARATSMAVRRDPRVVGVPSTKGTLTS